jgi:hypothetical protein
MMIQLSRKQERLYHELLKSHNGYDQPRITREYVLSKYPTDALANKRLYEGLHDFSMGFTEDYEEKEKRRIESMFPGITQYGCDDPLHDYESHFKNCDTCPRNEKCKKDLEWIKRELDSFGSRRKKLTLPKPKRKIIKKPVKRCRCKK